MYYISKAVSSQLGMNRFKKLFCLLISFLLLSAILYFVNQAFYRRMGAFGCFDQCFNFVAAYFMLKGKTLYSQIFFNHQPIMAYLSFFIQTVFQPKTLYHLVLFHRLFIIVFSLIMDAFLIFRFRWTGLGFVFFYETTKYYLFGNAFLPEALVIYPLVFLFGLVWEKLKNLKITIWDYLLAGIAAWWITFLTLPYAPVTLLLLGLILFAPGLSKKARIILSLSFIVPAIIILSLLPLKEYFFNLFIVNQKIAVNEAKATGMVGLGLLKAFFYPLLIFSSRESGFFKNILTSLNFILIISASLLVFKFKKYKEVLIIFTILGCSLTRFVPPGKVFYETFHLLPWYSLFLFSIFLLAKELVAAYLIWLSLAIVFIYITLSPAWFVREKVDFQTEFSTNYTHYYVLGQTIKQLSSPDDTLFLDLWDDLIYWQANLDSSYPYSLYTPILSSFSHFQEERLKMFREKPPDFYYSFCDKEILRSSLLPDESKNDYTRIFSNGKPTCFYIKKDKLAIISKAQWEAIKSLGYHLEKNKNTPEKKSPKIDIIEP